MLEVGNGGMSLSEYRAHFALWALLKAPLLIGTDVSNMSKGTADILMAKEVIAVNQDPLGVAGDLIQQEARGRRCACFRRRAHMWSVRAHAGP